MECTSLSKLEEDIGRAGFCLCEWLEDAPLDALAMMLGCPIASVLGRPLVDVLTPKAQDESQPGTLSFVHGRSAFPFHTETAHWRVPVDWVILRCVNPGAGNRPTILVDGWDIGLEEDETRRLTQSLMVVKSGSKSFLAPLITEENGLFSFRHDPGCMKPASVSDKPALDILDQRLSEASRTVIQWNAGQCLVFDNRRMLHSRADSSVADCDRQLERVYVVRKRGFDHVVRR